MHLCGPLTQAYVLLIRDFQKAASILAIFKPDFTSKLAKLHTVTLMYFSCPFFFKCLHFFLHQNESSTCLPLRLIICHVLCFYDARFSKSLITSAFSLKNLQVYTSATHSSRHWCFKLFHHISHTYISAFLLHSSIIYLTLDCSLSCPSYFSLPTMSFHRFAIFF